MPKKNQYIRDYETKEELCPRCDKVERWTANKKQASGNYSYRTTCDKCKREIARNRPRNRVAPKISNEPTFKIILDNPTCNACDVQTHCEKRITQKLRKFCEM